MPNSSLPFMANGERRGADHSGSDRIGIILVYAACMCVASTTGNMYGGPWLVCEEWCDTATDNCHISESYILYVYALPQ